MQDERDLRALWQEAFPEADVFSPWCQDPNRYANTLIIRGNGGISAAIYLVERTVSTGQGTARILGIGNVACAVAARGQGLIRKLLHGVDQVAQDRGTDFGLLFTGTPGVYAGSGWHTYDNEFLLARPQPDGNNTAVSPSVPYRDLDAAGKQRLRALYQGWARQVPFAALRGPVEWEFTDRAYESAQVVLCEAGYAIVQENPERTRVAEFVPVVGQEKALANQLSRVLMGSQEFEIRVHRTPAVVEALTGAFGPLATETDSSAMIHPYAWTVEQARTVVEAPAAQFSVGDYF